MRRAENYDYFLALETTADLAFRAELEVAGRVPGPQVLVGVPSKPWSILCLRPGDRIIDVNGSRVKTPREAREALAEVRPFSGSSSFLFQEINSFLVERIKDAVYNKTSVVVERVPQRNLLNNYGISEDA